MELLSYAAAQSGDASLADIVAAHSRTLLRCHLRKETCVRKGYHGALYSTPHLVNFEPKTGRIKETRTAQGYSDNSTWSRGQSFRLGAGNFYVYPAPGVQADQLGQRRDEGLFGWSYVDNWEWGQHDDMYGLQAYNKTTRRGSSREASLTIPTSWPIPRYSERATSEKCISVFRYNENDSRLTA
ncbi:hypothetical protein B0I35DRAFT_480621 [Stachybotrys elegans]|uniref:Uncharacterized protein n=1 Tax=Stachybotrys elegans TaxID=80388 RepID=A0A8K0SP73_9HYPO|nr:hypothetical protein B0I35DRAFT_480621 [Stachybotrys elegans]